MKNCNHFLPILLLVVLSNLASVSLTILAFLGKEERKDDGIDNVTKIGNTEGDVVFDFPRESAATMTETTTTTETTETTTALLSRKLQGAGDCSCDCSQSPTPNPTPPPTPPPTVAPTRSPTRSPMASPSPPPTMGGGGDAQFLSCPGEEGMSTTFVPAVADGGAARPVTLFLSFVDRLCALSLVTDDGSGQLRQQPVARSYNGNAWEVSAGDFVGRVPIECNFLVCTVNVPPLPVVGSGGGTRLLSTTMSYYYQLTTHGVPPTYGRGNDDSVARFLEQATFGPTRSDIDNFFGVAKTDDLDAAYGGWISHQVSVLPPSSHRELYRKRLNARMEFATRFGSVTMPCQRGTRYRRFAFSMRDVGRNVEIRTINDGTNRRTLSIDGFVRTVVDGPVYDYFDESVTFSDGFYNIASMWGANRVGGMTRFEYPGLGEIEIAIDGGYGNPAIEFDPSTQGAGPNLLVSIPSSSARYYDGPFFRHHTPSVPEQEFVLTRDLTDPLCATLQPTGNPENPVFALFDGRYWVHDPRHSTLENTLESPDPSGGGQQMRDTLDVIEPTKSPYCANAPRTFLNEGSCALSYHPAACEPISPIDSWELAGDDRPDFWLRITDETIRELYEITGDGAEGTRYVYAVDGLRIEDDPEIPRPCDAANSRWVPVPCSDASSSVHPDVHEIFSILLEFEINDGDIPDPRVVDIWNWWDEPCPDEEYSKVGFEVRLESGSCYKNVHEDHLSVWDMTYWVGAHPGGPERIRRFAENGLTRLSFPASHELVRWQDNKWSFGLVAWKIDDYVHYYDLPSDLHRRDVNEYFGFTADSIVYEDSGGVVVCGSPNEVANDLSLGGSVTRGAFDSLDWEYAVTNEDDFEKQKRMVWTDIVMSSPDQLRQRVAWALSQILAISPDAIENARYSTEPMVAYYDIFVRNAFGTYRDVLKEVSFSAVMAEMLTFYGGQSTAYIWQNNGNLEYADENYAREIMQLFTTGLYKLNPDGTHIMADGGAADGNSGRGDPLRVYTNDDIVEYARAWTGFLSQRTRANIESNYGDNQVDPMRVRVDYRDPYPKMGLERTYVGDGYPLCADLPEHHFLRRGARYRLLAPNAPPELQIDPDEWRSDTAVQRLVLQAGGGGLFAKLCGSSDGANCQFKPIVVLDQDVPCTGTECNLDTVRTVEVANGVSYEYVRPPCVYRAFFDNAKLVIRRQYYGDYTCADPETQVGSSACCFPDTDEGAMWSDMYWGERTNFATAQLRCSGIGLCGVWPRPSCDDDDPMIGSLCYNNGQFWTDNPCKLRAKIDRDGNVAIVHVPQDVPSNEVWSFVNSETKTFFRVDWSDMDAAKNLASACGTAGVCSATGDGGCMCDVSVTEEQVFFSGTASPSLGDVMSSLHIGSFDPIAGGGQTVVGSLNGGELTVYTKNGALTADSVFEFTDGNGMQKRRKNVRSTVTLDGTSISFRNPVHFVSLSDAEPRDALDETDAVLDHYFYHPNVAPFLAIRFAQRFGFSNPSPRFIEAIGTAFRTGSYSYSAGGTTYSFGSGSYGDLAATVACVLLDREARTLLLEADPSFGSLREPLMKVVGLMRSMEFVNSDIASFPEFGVDAGNKVGQMAHDIPNVFSFFRPEFQPQGGISQAGLVAPEAQVLSGPRLIDSLNGYMSMIRYGFGNCFGGLGPDRWYDYSYDCDEYQTRGDNAGIKGTLTYTPTVFEKAEDLVDEIATLLTAGRMSLQSREIIDQVVNDAPNVALKIARAQELTTFAPEFHSTNRAVKSGSTRPPPVTPQPSNNPYKAIVYIFLDGGMDSYNMLAPHTCAVRNAAGQTLREQYHAERTTIAMNDEERFRIIDATGQPCSQFAVHPDLPIVEQLYKQGDLSFFANVGVINRPANKDNYWEMTRTQLFAHNAMFEEGQRIDPYDTTPGTGVLGRACDSLIARGYNAQPITVEDATVATVGAPGVGTDPLLVSPYGAEAFNAQPWYEDWNPRPYLDQLNDATVPLQSSLFGETWSKGIQKALADNESVLQALSTTQLLNTFPDTDYALKLQAAATLIASHETRGSDRDVIFVNLPGWDHHATLKPDLSAGFQELNGALDPFVQELKDRNKWNEVTTVVVSEFARTLTANSGEGSDHAWGGNYFVTGGAVAGGRIHGSYPGDITRDGPLNLGRGRLIPTMSWESMWYSVLEWFDVPLADMDMCLPNRHLTETRMYTKAEVFNS